MFENSIIYISKYLEQTVKTLLYSALRDLHLTAPQYATLSLLKVTPGLSGAALARRSFVTPQTMNTIITNLESAGLIERRPHPEFGSVLQAYLTTQGEDLLKEADVRAAKVEKVLLSGLDEPGQKRLLATLQEWAGTLEDCEERMAGLG